VENRIITVCPVCGGSKLRVMAKIINGEVYPVNNVCELCKGAGKVEQIIIIKPFKEEVKDNVL
jgi:DnaJ-class molecular chaperone